MLKLELFIITKTKYHYYKNIVCLNLLLISNLKINY